MVALWMGGKKLDSVEKADLLDRLLRVTERVELRDETGEPLGEYIPPGKPWDAELTPEELQKLLAEPEFTYDEVKRIAGRA